MLMAGVIAGVTKADRRRTWPSTAPAAILEIKSDKPDSSATGHSQRTAGQAIDESAQFDRVVYVQSGAGILGGGSSGDFGRRTLNARRRR